MEHSKTFVGLFFAHLPQFEHLEAYEASVKAANEGRLTPSIQPSCCRELIFTEERILVSPSLDDENVIVIIVQKEVTKSKKFLDLLSKLNIQIQRNVDLTKSLFQYCLAFTMSQKLAPLWNKVGKFYVQGRDFLTDFGKLNAIRIDVNITDKLCIALEALIVKLSASKPEHFCSAANTLAFFNTNLSYEINRFSVEDNLCYILPSFKRGQVVSISHKLARDGVFNDYEALRKHWKVMYGWRLPVDEEVFYNVEFYYIPETIFTYPGSCIRSREPIITYRCDQQAIFASLIRDLQNRMPTMCGTPIRFTTTPLYPVDKLHTAASINQSNLTRAVPLLKSCKQFEIGMQRINSAPAGANQPASKRNSAGSRECGGQRTSVNVSTCSTTAITVASDAKHSSSSSSVVNKPRIVPKFTSFKLHSTDTRQQNNTQRKSKSVNAPSVLIIPRFGLAAKPSDSAKRKEKPKIVDKHKVPCRSSRKEPEREIFPNSQNREKNGFPLQGTVAVENRSVDQTSGLCTVVSNKNASGMLKDSAQSQIPEERGCVTDLLLVSFSCEEDTRKIPDKPDTSAPARQRIAAAQEDGNMVGTYAWKPCEPQQTLANIRDPVVESNNPKKKATNVQIGNDSDQPLKKKARSKPKVQEGVDVKEFALNNKLNKLNALTLTSWLKERGVVVRSKDKKTELVEKVVQYLDTDNRELY